jgi:UrcA family protein
MRTLALATLTAAALCAAPALAQPYANSAIDELTVTGQLPPAPGERPMSLSATVSYADLDLRLSGDRMRLEHRVNNAARRVCTELNEASPNQHNLGKSCQDLAVRGAMGQVRQAFASADSTAYVNTYGAQASATVPDTASYQTATVDNGPIPDTPANRARYGGPNSHAGRRTAPSGN